MDDPAKTGATVTTTPSSMPELSLPDEEEFARIRRRTRHPALALGAAVLALFLLAKMRFDLAFFLSTRSIEDLGDARALVSTTRGRHVLEEGRNRMVRIHGTPDRESALVIDTQGSWTFTQFFRLLGTDSRLFVHRREDPLPAFRAEQDVFEGRLMRFGDLSFEDSIRAYFTSHVSATHFFRTEDIQALVATGISAASKIRDLAGDEVTLGPNVIVAIDVWHPGELEIGLSAKTFPDAESARVALAGRGISVTGPGRAVPDRQAWRVAVTPQDRDRVLNAIAGLDPHPDIREVRETNKIRLVDLAIRSNDGSASHSLMVKPGISERAKADSDAPGGSIIESIRTLATVQISDQAYLIVEGETPREHLPEAGVGLVLVAFASVNLIGLFNGFRVNDARDKGSRA